MEFRRVLFRSGGGTGAGAIGTGQEDRDHVSHVRVGQRHLVAQPVERGAATTDHTDGLIRRHTKPVGDGDRVIAADERAELAAGRPLMLDRESYTKGTMVDVP